MKELSDIELFQCKFTSNLFEYSTKVKECSSKVFIKAYIYSSISRMISSKSFFIGSSDVVTCYEEIKKEKKLKRGSDVYPSYVMAWIGYIIKYFECSTGVPQTTVYKKIKPEELYSLYEAYHSLDNELVVKRIAEAKNINIELNNIEIMKKQIV